MAWVHTAHIKLIAVAILVCVIVVVGCSVTIHQTLINTREHLPCIYYTLFVYVLGRCLFPSTISVPSYLVSSKPKCVAAGHRAIRLPLRPYAALQLILHIHRSFLYFSSFCAFGAVVTKSHAGQSAIEKTRLLQCCSCCRILVPFATHTHMPRFNALHWWIGLSPRGYHGYKIVWPLSTCVCVRARFHELCIIKIMFGSYAI